MNDNNERRQKRGAHFRGERAQNRPAEHADRPKRSGGKHKNGKLLSTEKVNHSSYDWRNRLVAKLVEETEPPTEAPTEPTESPTESPTEKPTEPEPTEPPTDAPTESTGGDEEAP